jgi:hypothetical protein
VDEEGPQVIANMRARAEQCRRLAAALTDRRSADMLLKMAEDVEADIARLEGSPDMPSPIPPPPQG